MPNSGYADDLVKRLIAQSREESRVMRLETEKLLVEAADCIRRLDEAYNSARESVAFYTAGPYGY